MFVGDDEKRVRDKKAAGWHLAVVNQGRDLAWYRR
jgi:hypothetical protein